MCWEKYDIGIFTFFNPTIALGGGFKAPLDKIRVFGTFLLSKWPKKNRLFPNTYDNAFHTLSGSQNGLKMGFYYNIFVIGGTIGAIEL